MKAAEPTPAVLQALRTADGERSRHEPEPSTVVRPPHSPPPCPGLPARQLRAPGTWRAAVPREAQPSSALKSAAPPGAERPTTPGTSATAAPPPPPPAHLRSAAPGEARRSSAVPRRPPPPGPQPPPPPGDRPAPPASRPPPPSLPASLSARRCRPWRERYRWCRRPGVQHLPQPSVAFSQPSSAIRASKTLSVGPTSMARDRTPRPEQGEMQESIPRTPAQSRCCLAVPECRWWSLVMEEPHCLFALQHQAAISLGRMSCCPRHCICNCTALVATENLHLLTARCHFTVHHFCPTTPSQWRGGSGMDSPGNAAWDADVHIARCTPCT